MLLDPNAAGDNPALREIIAGLPFLEIEIVKQPDFELMVNTIYATDRHAVPKGVVEIIQWS